MTPECRAGMLPHLAEPPVMATTALTRRPPKRHRSARPGRTPRTWAGEFITSVPLEVPITSFNHTVNLT
jgi:hypothetical protein